MRSSDDLKKINKMRFLNVCSGIGGGYEGLKEIGMLSVGYSEIDKKAIETYSIFFGSKNINFGDVNLINPEKLSFFDLFIAGFSFQLIKAWLIGLVLDVISES